VELGLRTRGYHCAVRHWFLIVMVALLPLRGWVGDSMAAQMVFQQVAQAGSQGVMADCPGHNTDAGEDAALDVSGTSCTTCQLCCAPALQSAADIGFAAAPAQARPFRGAEGFASAAAPPGFKPPIS
jgi:hypothetical protein